MRYHLNGVPNGTWMDALDQFQTPLSPKIPASSLYHIMTAYAALDAYLGTGSV